MSAQILPNPVDRVEILSVIDNVLDLLLLSTDVAKRIGPGAREGQPQRARPHDPNVHRMHHPWIFRGYEGSPVGYKPIAREGSATGEP